VNNPALTARMLPSLQRAAGAEHVREIPYITAAEDFAAFAQAIPSLYFFVGITPAGQDLATVSANHSSRFYMDEQALDTGVRAMLAVALDYLTGKAPPP
jgi:amidohydrolase